MYGRLDVATWLAVRRKKALFLGSVGEERPAVFSGIAKSQISQALAMAQHGGKHPKAKPWNGQGLGVLEIAV